MWVLCVLPPRRQGVDLGSAGTEHPLGDGTAFWLSFQARAWLACSEAHPRQAGCCRGAVPTSSAFCNN